MGQILSRITQRCGYKTISPKQRQPQSNSLPATKTNTSNAQCCEKCQEAGEFIKAQLSRPKENTKKTPDRSLPVGHLSLLRSRTDYKSCQSIVSALLETGHASAPDIGQTEVQLRFDGINFYCDVRLVNEDFDERRGPMLIKTEPVNGAECSDPTSYGRLIDFCRVDIGLIREWIDACNHLHGPSISHIAPTLVQSQLPWLYLIDLERESLVRVSVSAEPQYTALSYVWGRVEMLKTTKENLNRMQQPGALSIISKFEGHHIPNTISDAMYLASQLGVKYFWTDCLCIVQDDESTKGMFINAMASIYARAYFTIVAGEGSDGNFGISGTRSYLKPRNIPFRYMHFPGYSMQTENMNELSDKGAAVGTPWASRAWTFQEAFFSRRLLIFNGTFNFFCGDFRSEEWLADSHGYGNETYEQ